MKKALKIGIGVLLGAFVGIQFIPTNRNESNIVPDTDLMQTFSIPKEVGNIIKNSCYDCHSNHTDYPWYNKIQPLAWLLEDHITQGKDELNFSAWADYSDRRKKSKLKSIKSQIEDGEMPLWSYAFIHSDKKLSEKDKKLLFKWVNSSLDSLN